MRLGKRSQYKDIPSLPHVVERARIINVTLLSKVLREFVVCLINHNRDVLGNLIQKTVQRRRVKQSAGRVVRVREKNDPRIGVDRLNNGIEIKSVVAQRRLDERRSRGSRDDLILN